MDDERQENGGMQENNEAGGSTHDEFCFPPDDGGNDAAGYEAGNGNIYTELGDCEPGNHEPGHEGPLPSWERMEDVGFFKALFQSIEEILMNTRNTFRRMPQDGEHWHPFGFAAILCTIGMCGAILWSNSITLLFMGVIDTSRFEFPPFWLLFPLEIFTREIWGPILYLTLQFAVIPIYVPFMILFGAALLHLSLILTGGARYGFASTFRLFCYVVGVAMLFYVVPFCGNAIGGIWYLFGLCIAAQEVHKTGFWRILIAILIQPFICFCGLCIFMVVFGPALSSQ